jgi:deaminated glutathione amidase
VKSAGKALVGVAGIAGLSQLSVGSTAEPKDVPLQTVGQDKDPKDRLRVATCQFPVSGSFTENGKFIQEFMHKAAEAGAHLLHTSEACLSGYAGIDVPSLENYDWNGLRQETAKLRKLAQELRLWLVLGSTHFLGQGSKPTNCLYLVDPEGRIADRYDKCFCTGGDQRFYSAGNRLVTRDIRGVRIGLAICYDICWPQLYIGYREKGATVMIHSFHNARSKGKNCLDTLNIYQVPTRCADNRMWAVCNNSSLPYSHWGSFVARPDATIPKRLEINQPGMLVHDFPDGLSEDGWWHNLKPMQKREEEIMHWGTPSDHPRQKDGQAEP